MATKQGTWLDVNLFISWLNSFIINCRLICGSFMLASPEIVTYYIRSLSNLRFSDLFNNNITWLFKLKLLNQCSTTSIVFSSHNVAMVALPFFKLNVRSVS